MRLYALVETGDTEAIDIYLSEQDAHCALEDCLRDEPGWRGRSRWARTAGRLFPRGDRHRRPALRER